MTDWSFVNDKNEPNLLESKAMFGTNLFCLIKKVGFRSEFCTKLVKSEKKNVNAYFQAIGTGGAGDSASVCLKIDRKKYLKYLFFAF